MKAAVLTQTNAPFEIAELDLDGPGAREVVVEVKASGLCHSDLHLAHSPGITPLPAVLGHELAGIVSAVGPGVTSVAVGDRVVGSLVGFCGACASCAAGRTYACRNADAVRRAPGDRARISRDGSPVHQGLDLGAFAEQALVHENNLVRVGDDIPLDRAAVLGCAVITGVGAVVNTRAIEPGGTVAVIGCGGVGLNVIQGATWAGAQRIFAVDTAPDKLELAQRFGATDLIDVSTCDPLEVVQDLTVGDGVNAAFDVVGSIPTSRQALGMVGRGGTAYLVGMHRLDAVLEINPMMDGLIGAGKGLRGVYMGFANTRRDIPLYVDMYLQGRLNLDDLVSRQIALEDINLAYEELERGALARSVIVF